MSSQDQVVESLTKTIEIMTNEIALLREQVACLTQKLYGKSSEKMPRLNGQLSLFEDNNLPEEEDDLPS